MDRKYKSRELLRRFLPYYKNHKRVLFTDLFCAALTTVCEIVLPLIVRFITDRAMTDVTLLTFSLLVELARL